MRSGEVAARVDGVDREVGVTSGGAGRERTRTEAEVEQAAGPRQLGQTVEEPVVEVAERGPLGDRVAPRTSTLERVPEQDPIEPEASGTSAA